MKIGIFTIASKNYLPYVRVLMKSVEAVHPEYHRMLCLADRVNHYFDPEDDNFEVIQAEDLGIPNFHDMAFRYDIMEFNTAVKPFMFQWVFENSDLDAVIYLDPDIRVFTRMEELEKRLAAGESMVLTPHITRPLEDDLIPNDAHMLQSGVFNLGFVAFRRTDEAMEFIKWWGRRLEKQCVAELDKGLFVDQKWCDLAPCFVEKLSILRDHEYNVAYWNILNRRVEKTSQGWQVDGRDMVFFHYSGVDASASKNLSKHQNRFKLGELPVIRRLITDYIRDLRCNGLKECANFPYAYGTFVDGQPILPLYRKLYARYGRDSSDRIMDFETIKSICNHPSEHFEQIGDCVITRLMAEIHAIRPDVQKIAAAQPTNYSTWFANWFEASGSREYNFPPELTQQREIINGATANHETVSGRRNKLASCMKAPTTAIEQLVEGEQISESQYMLWKDRPDLTTAFDLNTQQGQQDYLCWFRISVEREYGIKPEAFEVEMKDSAADDGTSSPGRAGAGKSGRTGRLVFYRLLIWLERPLKKLPRFLRRKGKFLWQKALVRAAGPDMKLFRTTGRKNGPDESTCPGGNHRPKPGANLVGYIKGELGMGEHVRMVAKAMGQTRLPYGLIDFDFGLASRKEAEVSHEYLQSDNRYAVNVFHINADQMVRSLVALGPKFFEGRYNVGYWAWELGNCPDEWLSAISIVDEIWAPSRFIQKAFQAKVDIPVTYMPLCQELPPLTPKPKSYFGLDDNSYVFIFSFDFFSYLHRKNPFAVIEAFKRAFADRGQKVQLVLKVMNGDTSDAQWKRMVRSIAGDKRIKIINKTMSKEDLISLKDACDCYVSLHRSEGFGRGPFEAMYLGKPVIATNFSGNVDFMTAENSCLVDYTLIPVEKGQYPFSQGQVWADPCIEQASDYMRNLASEPEMGRELGKRAEEYVRKHFNPKTIGQRYERRILEILSDTKCDSGEFLANTSPLLLSRQV